MAGRIEPLGTNVARLLKVYGRGGSVSSEAILALPREDILGVLGLVVQGSDALHAAAIELVRHRIIAGDQEAERDLHRIHQEATDANLRWSLEMTFESIRLQRDWERE